MAKEINTTEAREILGLSRQATHYVLTKQGVTSRLAGSVRMWPRARVEKIAKNRSKST